MRPFKIDAVVACDDVRKESSGKDILIGVYPAGVTMFPVPGQIRLAFWIRLTGARDGDLSVELKAEPPGSKASFSAKTEIKALPAGSPIALILPAIGYPIQEEGEFKVYCKNSDEGWEEIYSFLIRQGSSSGVPASPGAPSPPPES